MNRFLPSSRCLLLCVLLALPGLRSGYAQQTNDGSIYSRFGLGELRTFYSSQIQAMGGGGTGFPSFNAMNLSNPASWGAQVLTRVSGGLFYENIQATDASDARSRLASGTFNGVHISFPLKSQTLGVGLAFVPFSRVSYRVAVEGTLPATDGLEEVPYVVNYKGNGGLQQIVGGFGWQINNHIAAGAAAHFIFGILEERRETRFASGAYQRADVANATRLAGITGTGGVLIRLPGVFRQQDALSVGLTLTLPATLTGTRVRTLETSVEADTLGGELSGKVHLPYGLGFGVAYRPDLRWTFIADARYEPWSTFESDFTFPGYTPGGHSLQDRLRLSAGIEFLPAGRDLLASYFRRTAYRIGFYVDRSYASPLPEETIRTFALTGGLSLPTLNAGTRIDLNVELGTRGTTERGLIRDRFIRIGVNLNLGELWFVKRKLG
ncbi:MAG: hypothetical protein KatS3mg044_0469 [Rhodothermaceae bacterium]|nr:MAG: hypothetical protein KatS3mg044_0469 [Rhodothermaceae bacterium]